MNELIELMEQVETSGAFSVNGAMPPIQPGLNVKGVGQIALPLIEHQAKELIEFSQQAPFGLGEATVVDTTVRNAWQISAEDFELTNPQWSSVLQQSVDEIGRQLGLDRCEITFEQYKLLIYEEGCFFTAHRDTEKADNMFATLVVNLPSQHAGGELIVSHAGQSQSYSFANNDLFNPNFVAFYADCLHEVKPITAGYRICLIYNLSIANRAEQPLLSKQSNVAKEISNLIQKWIQKKTENPILIYLLEHGYTKQNLTLSNLKLNDFGKVSALLNAAEEHDCQAFLCLATYYRTSYGEMGYYANDPDEDGYEEYEVEAENFYAHQFINASGTAVSFAKMELEEDELIAKTPLLGGPGGDYSVSGPTGNDGATKDLWYHRGAVILWQKEREFELMDRVNLDYRIDFFKRSVHKRKMREGANRPQLIELADDIIAEYSPYGRQSISSELILLGEIDLVKKYINKQINRYRITLDAQAFVKIAEHFGWHHFEEDMGANLTEQQEVLSWLNDLLHRNNSISSAGKSTLKKWMTSIWKPSLTYQLTIKQIETLIENISLLKMNALTDPVIQFLSAQKKGDFLTAVYGPAVINSFKMPKQSDYDKAIMSQFADDVRQHIQADFPAPPEKPADWSRQGRLDCDCEFCTEVNRFLPDPERSEISFYKTLKRNLLHIESKAQESLIDLDLQIERASPKFHGTFRKNQNRYEKKRKLFNKAQKIVKDLQQQESGLS